MKKMILIIGICSASITAAFAKNNNNLQIINGDTTSCKEQIYKPQVLIFEGSAYINLKVKNQKEACWYAVSKHYEDGTSEIIGIKKSIANTLDTPILFSFIDEELNNEKVIYVLLKKTPEGLENMFFWSYTPQIDTKSKQILEAQVYSPDKFVSTF